MSCGNPQGVPCSQVLDGASPYHDGGPGQTGDERIRPPGNAAVVQAARQGPRFSSRPNVQGRQAIPPRTAAGTAPCSPASSSRTATGGGNPAREDLPSGPSGENLAAARAPTARP